MRGLAIVLMLVMVVVAMVPATGYTRLSETYTPDFYDDFEGQSTNASSSSVGVNHTRTFETPGVNDDYCVHFSTHNATINSASYLYYTSHPYNTMEMDIKFGTANYSLFKIKLYTAGTAFTFNWEADYTFGGTRVFNMTVFDVAPQRYFRSHAELGEWIHFIWTFNYIGNHIYMSLAFDDEVLWYDKEMSSSATTAWRMWHYQGPSNIDQDLWLDNIRFYDRSLTYEGLREDADIVGDQYVETDWTRTYFNGYRANAEQQVTDFDREHYGSMEYYNGTYYYACADQAEYMWLYEVDMGNSTLKRRWEVPLPDWDTTGDIRKPEM